VQIAIVRGNYKTDIKWKKYNYYEEFHFKTKREYMLSYIPFYFCKDIPKLAKNLVKESIQKYLEDSKRRAEESKKYWENIKNKK
jgi:hypothetical protein